MGKDIFISYKNDGSGNHFANRLCQDLESIGYSVYFNPNEERAVSFPERLKTAVSNCKDFILVLSAGCLEQLKENKKIDWVREEILTAREQKKHIIPILLENVKLPQTGEEFPECLNFLPFIDAIQFTEQYMRSPFGELTGVLLSKNNGNDAYRDAYNSNSSYKITEEYRKTLERAEEGDYQAMYEIGLMSFYGAASERENEAAWDFERAAYWLKRLSESESEFRYHADNLLARMYYQGLIPTEPQSYEKSFQYHQRAAEFNDSSKSNLAFMLRIGAGCEFDFKRIVDYYAEIRDKGDDMALMALAQFLTTYGKFDEALELYESMTLVSPEADYQIGLLYKSGVINDPPKPDYIQASYYFRNAADNNHLQAAYEYALMCFRPTGRFKKNFKEAEKYFKIAADGGVALAQYMLGFMYKAGSVQKDLNKAVEYFEKAREQSHSLSALELATIYQQPEFKNYEQAYQCAEMAASHGVGEAEFILGNLLFWGRGCEADINKAQEMYQRAVDHGFYSASLMLEKLDEVRNR